MENKRMSRVDSEIQKNLAKIISRFDDSDFMNTIISIVKVETFSDFSLSKIYISVFGDKTKKDNIVNKLNDNKKTIRFELAHMIRVKNIPELIFIADEMEEKAERMDKLFKQIEGESNGSR